MAEKTYTYESQTFSAEKHNYHKIPECLATTLPKHPPNTPYKDFKDYYFNPCGPALRFTIQYRTNENGKYNVQLITI